MALKQVNAKFSLPLIAAIFLLSGCNFAAEADEKAPEPTAKAKAAPPAADPFASHDTDAPGGADESGHSIMQAQVLLDRLGFAPGVIDDKMGMSTTNAIKGFQTANDLSVTGELDEATRTALLQQKSLPATRMVTIPADFANQDFVTIPAAAEAKAKLAALGYENLMEALAERFHTTPDTLRALNSGATPVPAKEAGKTEANAANATNDAAIFASGKEIRVPNVGGDGEAGAEAAGDAAWKTTLKNLGISAQQPQAAKIVVDESDGVLRAFDAGGKLLVQFTATMGSKHDPLPIGSWKVNGVAYNPPFTYNPKLFWDVSDKKPKQQFKPGPNSPVGVVWIDLSKDHYGIHGTPSPETIGRAESHGCVRLTNWDAARLAMMVKPGVPVVFQK